jgi:hypothetical protein
VAVLAAAKGSGWIEAVDGLVRVRPSLPGAVLIGCPKELVLVLRQVVTGPVTGGAELALTVKLRLQERSTVGTGSEAQEEPVQPPQPLVRVLSERILGGNLQLESAIAGQFRYPDRAMAGEAIYSSG